MPAKVLSKVKIWIHYTGFDYFGIMGNFINFRGGVKNPELININMASAIRRSKLRHAEDGGRLLGPETHVKH